MKVRQVEKDIEIILVGNKCDKEEERKVELERAKKFAESNSMLHYETSAMNDINVIPAFEELVKRIVERGIDVIDNSSYQIDSRDSVKLDDYHFPENENKCGC